MTEINIQEIKDQNAYLQKKHDELAQARNQFIVPDTYDINKFEFVDQNVASKAKEKAKEMGYTQAQFERELKLRLERNKAQKEQQEQLKKEIEDLDSVVEFGQKELGLSENSIKKLDVQDLKALKERREKSLNTSTSMGTNHSSGIHLDPETKRKELAREMVLAHKKGDKAEIAKLEMEMKGL